MLCEALVLRNPADVKGRTLVRLDLALTYVQEGDATQACRILHEALAVPRDSLVEPALRQVHVVRRELEPWSGTPAVKALDEQLRSVA